MSKFVCQSCVTIVPSWSSKCPSCGQWNTIAEESARKGAQNSEIATAVSSTVVESDDEEKTPTGISELDRVLEGGIVPGAVHLLSGEPGSGKSTLLLQLAGAMAREGYKAVYASGEETAGQVSARAQRLGVAHDDLMLVATSSIDDVLRAVDEIEPIVAIVDSAQTMGSDELESELGTASQLKKVAQEIVSFAKASGVTFFIIGHITKDGAIAGPKVFEHLVDAVHTFEGDRHHALRVLRTEKNRYAPTREIGLFEMTGKGMKDVPSASAWLLSERSLSRPGSVVAAACSGSKGMLVEVQALVGSNGRGRVVNGCSASRVGLILSVLRDVVVDPGELFVNVPGGMEVDETGIDLGVAVALASSVMATAVENGVCVFGEVGLTGEVRGVGRPDVRIHEAALNGFRKVIVPRSCSYVEDGIDVVRVRTVDEAVSSALGVRMKDFAKAVHAKNRLRNALREGRDVEVIDPVGKRGKAKSRTVVRG